MLELEEKEAVFALFSELLGRSRKCMELDRKPDIMPAFYDQGVWFRNLSKLCKCHSQIDMKISEWGILQIDMEKSVGTAFCIERSWKDELARSLSSFRRVVSWVPSIHIIHSDINGNPQPLTENLQFLRSKEFLFISRANHQSHEQRLEIQLAKVNTLA